MLISVNRILKQINLSRFIRTKLDFHGNLTSVLHFLHEKAREIFNWSLVLSRSSNVLIQHLDQSHYRKLYIQFWLWPGLFDGERRELLPTDFDSHTKDH